MTSDITEKSANHNILDNLTVKEMARSLGADLVGIGAMSRFEGTAPERDPRFIAPQAKSIIGLGLRVLRGSLRGVEEGTQFYQYSTMGVRSIEENFLPDLLRRMACFLEDHGYEAAVQRGIPDRLPAGSEPVTNPEWPGIQGLEYARPVAPGKPAPDVLPDFKQAAYLCGLGEIGWGGFFLTPEFGPLQRFAFILTDAELEPDPLYGGEPLCDHCGACIGACPGQAILRNEQETSNWDGRKITRARTDSWQCSAYYSGAAPAGNPFLPPDVYKDLPDGAAIAKGEKRLSEEEAVRVRNLVGGYYGGVGQGYSASICGRACWRACLAHMEERKMLRKTFHKPFRPAVG